MTAKKYDFDADFQTKVAALVIRDQVFNRQTEGLVSPEYFSSDVEATLVNLSLNYWKKFKKTPDFVTFRKLVKQALDRKIIREEMRDDIKKSLGEIFRADITDRDYVVSEIGDFAKHQALTHALVEGVDLLDKRDFEKINKVLTRALDVGSTADFEPYDYFDQIDARTLARKELLAGVVVRGVTTGVRALDDLLHHKGWGFKELSILMGGAKRGKSIGLTNFAVNASLAGHNVLFITLEVSREITTDRMDSYISETKMREILDHVHDVRDKIKPIGSKSGKLEVHEYPTGTFKNSDLRRLIERYKSSGTTFDLCVVDYVQIMAPEHRYPGDKIREYKETVEGLRAIGQIENIAMLTAWQTNREGHKAATADAQHVAEDFNVVRTADILISINSAPDERERNEARLFFAASRNQETGMQVQIEQDLERMRFIKRVIGRI